MPCTLKWYFTAFFLFYCFAQFTSTILVLVPFFFTCIHLHKLNYCLFNSGLIQIVCWFLASSRPMDSKSPARTHRQGASQRASQLQHAPSGTFYLLAAIIHSDVRFLPARSALSMSQNTPLLMVLRSRDIINVTAGERAEFKSDKLFNRNWQTN